jgi:HJR/Mrr/RecB family endonuclease
MPKRKRKEKSAFEAGMEYGEWIADQAEAPRRGKRKRRDPIDGLFWRVLGQVVGKVKSIGSAQSEEQKRTYRQFIDVDPTQFEKNIGALFELQGFSVRHSGQTGDGGIDLRLQRDHLTYIAQCKRYADKPVAVSEVRDFYGALVDAGVHHGYFVTTSYFTRPAREFAQHKPITLVDADKLKQWIEHPPELPQAS